MASPPLPPASARPRRQGAVARPIAAGLALPEDHVGLIDRSHARCAALGLSRIATPEHAPLARGALTVVRERNQRLHAHAAPVMEMLFDQIVGTESMVVLCDATGTVIHSIGDDDFLARASKVALQPGANWSEQVQGTNAIGTALVDERPTLVHADEHYMHANHFLTCSAAPILDPRGNMLGVLDVTGDHRSYHQHTMALVKMSARMIENHWLSDDFRHAMRLHFHPRAEFIGTLMEGILAVSPDGRIVGANRGALELLGLSGAALRMQGLLALFGTTVGALVDRFRNPLATPLAVHTAAGRSVFLHARFDWPVWTDVTEAAAAAVRRVEPALPAEPAGPGLADLRTGDAAFEALLAKVRCVLDRGIALRLEGETGTGKELLARALHRDSARARRPFVVHGCAAAGADGAVEALAARVRRANGGTLFLDDVAQMAPAEQAWLLQLLQERLVERPGADGGDPLDLALVSAGTGDLRAAVAEGRFRADLFYRLDGLALRLPPLRERSDLPALARRLLDADAATRHLRLQPEALARLQAHAWPGNVRELANALRTAAALAGAGPEIGPEHLPETLAPAPAPAAGPGPSLEAVEAEAIRRAVETAGGNISAAARALGVSRNTVYRHLRRR